MGLIIKLNNPDTDVREIEQAISHDVSLSYKLLRYINSAMCALRHHVSSIGHAVRLLGPERIRTWASLILFSGFSDQLREVVFTGVVRARMSEGLAKRQSVSKPERHFLVGLLSVLDAVMGQPLDLVLRPLPLEPEIVDAVLHQNGSLGKVLHCVLAYERQHWEEARAAVNLTQQQVEEAYRESLKWTLSTLNGFASTECDASISK
jgi:EAL and modified HD-GYP domain-containing signal transduction protein